MSIFRKVLQFRIVILQRKVEVKEQIKNGRGLMSPLAHLPDKEIDEITGLSIDEAGQEMLMVSL